jgi:hypothetical protein
MLLRKLQRVFSNQDYVRLRNDEPVEDVLGVDSVDAFGDPIPTADQ